jgi:catechol-2,3-dioxygenase
MRIEVLELKAQDLVKQNHFYGNVLGLTTELSAAHLKVILPQSVLIFEKSDRTTPYHFAFNICENQIHESCEWLKPRCEILPDEDGLEIVDFPHWNAEAVYFLDAESNILEFIARHDLNNKSEQPFSSKSVQSISEIGCCGGDIKNDYQLVSEALGLEKYSGDFERFCAVGDPEGLLIMVTANRNWYPTQIPSQPSDFGVRLSHNGKSMHFNYLDKELQLT